MQEPALAATPDPSRKAAICVALAGMLAYWLVFALEGRYGFNFAEEGFLWYGVQRTLLGEVPTVDFHAYSPGRYYLAAALLKLTDAQGTVAVRAATTVFASIGVGAGMWLVWRGHRGGPISRAVTAAFAAAIFMLWMLPWWKSYDIAISIALVAGLAAVLANPNPMRFFGQGLLVGFAALIGRNHGVYGLTACLLAGLALMCAGRTDWLRCIFAWAAGIVLAFSPMWLAITFDVDFGAMFWNSMHYTLVEYHGTNISLPIPWPWLGGMPSHFDLAGLRPWMIGGMFLALPAFCVIGAAASAADLARKKGIANPIFVASLATAVPYLHVAFSRPDVPHLAQACFPFLIGVLACPWPKRFRNVAHGLVCVVLAAASLPITLQMHPGYLGRIQPNWVTSTVAGDDLRMHKAAADSVRLIQNLGERYVPHNGTVLAAPNLPGVYAMLGVKSPVWEIYPLYPRSEAFEKEEIARVERAHPALVLINDVAIDKNESYRYSRTHPLTQQYIEQQYKEAATPAKGTALKVYVPVDR